MVTMSDLDYIEGVNKISPKKSCAFAQKIRNSISQLFGCGVVKEVGNMIYKGKFDEKGNFVEGTIILGKSCKRTGKFENRGNHDVLREGKREYNSGLIEEGKFNEYEMFVQGERRMPNGIIYRGYFDVNTGDVYDGEIVYPDGRKEVINKRNKFINYGEYKKKSFRK